MPRRTILALVMSEASSRPSAPSSRSWMSFLAARVWIATDFGSWLRVMGIWSSTEAPDARSPLSVTCEGSEVAGRARRV